MPPPNNPAHPRRTLLDDLVAGLAAAVVAAARAGVGPAVEDPLADGLALQQGLGAAPLGLRLPAAAAALGDHGQAGRTRARVAEERALVDAVGVGAPPAARLAARVGDVAAVPLGRLALAAEALVVRGHVRGDVLAGGASPAGLCGGVSVQVGGYSRARRWVSRGSGRMAYRLGRRGPTFGRT